MAKRFFLGLFTALLLSVSAAAFSDVPGGHWAAEDIRRCAEAGYLTGLSAERFGLGSPMTRGGFVVALSRFFQWEEATLTAPYGDVAPGAWYESAVNAAYEQGALSTWEASFRPNDPITREEMAVLLVRALGYGEIAGLAQSMPFTDVTANRGYIALCHDFGLLSGTSPAAFSPDAPATREQAAAVLMRLHDRLAGQCRSIAVAEQWHDGLSSYETVVLTGAALKRTRVTGLTPAPESGKTVLLGVTAKPSALGGDPAAMARALASAVDEGGYGGLYLDLPAAGEKYRAALTALAEAVDGALGDKFFALTAEASESNNALAAAPDMLVLRPAQTVETLGDFTAAPVAASEECWLALRSVPAEHTALLLSASAHAWKNGKEADSFSVTEVPEDASYSRRYGCTYWEKDGKTVWYLGEEGIRQRCRLAALMGCGSVVVEL